MICGIFATVNNNVKSKWENNPHLDFTFIVSEKTGEISTDKKEAKSQTKGLTFTISDRNTLQSCYLRGSLHKEHNGINFDRFTFDNLQTVINRLQTQYHINPATTYIHSLEIEINLYLKYSPKQFIKSLISHKKQPFIPINKTAQTLGKIAVYDDHSIKFYDKARQVGIKGMNILRFGVKVSKMRYLQPYGIKTLADLQDINKVYRLGEILYKTIPEIVFYDYKADTSKLTELQALKYTQYSNPNYWQMLNRKQRYKAKIQYKKLSEKVQATAFNIMLLKWFSFEWQQLFDSKKKGTFTPFENKMTEQKKGTFTHFICKVQVSPDNLAGDTKNIKEKTTLNSKLKKQKCIVCGCDISHKKQGAKYCSKKHANIKSNETRRNKRIQTRINETKQLENIINSNNYDFNFLYTVKTNNGFKNKRANGNNFKLPVNVKIGSVTVVKVYIKPHTVTLTTKRAKEFIKYVTGQKEYPVNIAPVCLFSG